MLQKQTEGNSRCAAPIAPGVPEREPQCKVQGFPSLNKSHRV